MPGRGIRCGRRFWRTAGCREISVRDTGVGIRRGESDQNFDEFLQLENTSQNREKGSGLGLSICKRLVERMGGRLTLIGAGGPERVYVRTAAGGCRGINCVPMSKTRRRRLLAIGPFASGGILVGSVPRIAPRITGLEK